MTTDIQTAGSQMASRQTDKDLLGRFVEFSAWVTAFSTVDLWGTGQAEDYLTTVLEQVGEEILRQLLLASAPPPGPAEDPVARSARLKRDVFGNDELGPVARCIVKLWYSGIWYAPEWATVYGQQQQHEVPGQRQPGQVGTGKELIRLAPFVVSPAAYTEGLLWPAIGAHPMGAKAPGYGSWAEPPAIDEEFIEDNPG